MAKPAIVPKPNLHHLSSRRIKIPSGRTNLEFILLEWMREVVRHTSNVGTKDGVSPEMTLIATAEGIDDLLHAPASMSVGRHNDRTTIVYADFVWGGLANGHWYISKIIFKLSPGQQAMAHQGAVTERVRDRAEDDYAKKWHVREYVFNPEEHLDHWQDDVHRGYALIQMLVDRAHEHAQKQVPKPENPISPTDAALGLASGAVGAAQAGAETTIDAAKAGAQLTKEAVATAERVKTWAEVYEKAEEFKSGVETYEKMKEAMSEKKRPGVVQVIEKGRGDVLLDRAIDLASNIPGAGMFVKTFAGWAFDIAIANQAGAITNIRSRAYIFFVGGFIESLTYFPSVTPKDAFDAYFYNLGLSNGRLPKEGAFRAQIGLLHYASEHYTAGSLGDVPPAVELA